jgi:hypothetical protein
LPFFPPFLSAKKWGAAPRRRNSTKNKRKAYPQARLITHPAVPARRKNALDIFESMVYDDMHKIFLSGGFRYGQI